MSKKLSEHLGLDESEIDKLGVFNPILNVDSRFFIDPKSLAETTVPEFGNASAKLTKRYSEILTFTAQSKSKFDLMWQTAYKHFPKGEVKYTCLGYGFDNTDGRGMGRKLAIETLDTIKEFLDCGIDDPALLEIVGLFQRGIGSDLVSDMIAKVLMEELAAYTTRITDVLASKTNIKPITYTHGGATHRAFYNPYNKRMLLLVPKDILQPLPVAFDWDSVDLVSAQNEKVRQEFAKLVGIFNWKQRGRVPKDRLKSALLSRPEVARDLLKQYHKKPTKKAYDFATDPKGEYVWYEESQKITKENPLTLPSLPKVDGEHVDQIVRKIIDNFKRVIEDNGCWTSLYTRGDDKKIMHESYAQKLFYGVAHIYCEENNVDISPETNSGKGPIDFKFSVGKSAKVVVEIKLTSNSQLGHGFSTQVDEYNKAERPFSSYYLVLDVTAPRSYMPALNDEIAIAQKEKKSAPEVIFVNAKIQKSASKA